MMFETGFAKINLALHVRRRRPDGYHDLETIFAFCEDGDRIEAGPADSVTLSIDGPFADGLSPTDNLVVHAALALGKGRGAALRLTKNLPVASGIGGGSADAAATLRLLSRMWSVEANLQAIASDLGADVPACVASLTARGEGRGDDLQAADQLGGTPVLLVNPGVPLSTANVFAAWGGRDGGPLGNWRLGRNDLEDPASSLVPEITELVDWLARRRGAIVARMSGSGATCFALFDGMTSRDAAATEITRAFPRYWALRSVLR